MEMLADQVIAIDLFSGAGGFTNAARRAAEALGRKLRGIAVNHWKTAINTHATNHPELIHVCEPIESVRPQDLVAQYPDLLTRNGRPYIDLLIAAPECIHHSNARGGKPINDQSRSTAFRLFDWIEVFLPGAIIVENVPEFIIWGPVDEKGRRIRSKRGDVFQAWLQMLRSFGYTVEFRVINAADCGDPQTRKRFCLMAIRDTEGTESIPWPDLPYASPKKLKDTIFTAHLKPWRPARSFLDLGRPSQSIFTRKKPLAANTLERVYAGAEKFGWWEPFLVILRRHMDGLPIDGPLPTIAASGKHIALAEPFITRYHKGEPRAICDPLPTQTGTECFALAQPFILPHWKFNLVGSDSLDDPLRTIDATNGQSIRLAQGTAFLIPNYSEREGQSPRTHDIEEPMPTICASRSHQLAQAFLVNILHGNGNEDPATASKRRTYSLDDPIPTITTAHGQMLAESFLMQYNRTGIPKSLDEPLGTITTRDRFAYVAPIILHLPEEELTFGLDIHLRMLAVDELAAGMSFPSTYIFLGNQEQKVKQIGNAVCGEFAYLHILALLKHLQNQSASEMEPLQEVA